MTIKFLFINDFPKVKHLTNLAKLYDVECINIDDLYIKISELPNLNLPFNLKHIFIDLNIIEEEDRNKYAEFDFKSYTEAIQFIEDLAYKFKLPFNCKLTFRFYCKIFDNDNDDYYDYEFLYYGDKVIYDTFNDTSFKGKISKSYVELTKIIDEQKQKYTKDEIFGVSCKYVNRFCNLMNEL